MTMYWSFVVTSIILIWTVTKAGETMRQREAQVPHLPHLLVLQCSCVNMLSTLSNRNSCGEWILVGSHCLQGAEVDMCNVFDYITFGSGSVDGFLGTPTWPMPAFAPNI